MQLWVTLFLSFLTAFGAVPVVWWHLAARKNQRRITRLVEEVDPAKAVVTTTVLIPADAAQQGLSAMTRPIASPAEKRGLRLGARGRLVLLTLAMSAAGMVFGSRFQHALGPAAVLVGGFLLGVLPWALESRKQRKHLSAIEDQFPEMLDFLSRSVRAGNAFSASLELLAEECGEPLRSEFRKVSREQALGASLETALDHFLGRVPLIEARFFVAAVLLQRETGGSLAEVLGKLGIDIRERLRLRGHVKAASGHGRLTAKILTALPVVLVALLSVLSPAYLEGLTNKPMGRTLLGAAVISQILGYLWMNKITDIEV